MTRGASSDSAERCRCRGADVAGVTPIPSRGMQSPPGQARPLPRGPLAPCASPDPASEAPDAPQTQRAVGQSSTRSASVRPRLFLLRRNGHRRWDVSVLLSAPGASFANRLLSVPALGREDRAKARLSRARVPPTSDLRAPSRAGPRGQHFVSAVSPPGARLTGHRNHSSGQDLRDGVTCLWVGCLLENVLPEGLTREKKLFFGCKCEKRQKKKKKNLKQREASSTVTGVRVDAVWHAVGDGAVRPGP